jgi:hypothetical protein
VTYDGDENGGIRTIFLKPDLGGGSVSEQIYEIDPALRSLKYILTDFGDSPFAHYEGYMKVSSVGKKKSVIYYRATIFPTTISESDAADFAIRNMLGFQKRLNELL